jgi:methionyl aminopeptidase
MIHRRSPKEIELIQAAAEILIETFRQVETILEPGKKTDEIDKEIERFINKSRGKPAFKGYRGFPKSSCISIDEEVVHGIPGKRIIREGQIISIDIGIEYGGYFADAARTFRIGTITAEKAKLIQVTEEALQKGIEQTIEGNHISDIGQAIQMRVESAGFSVVRDLVGHGIGTQLHEEPEIPNFVDEHRRISPRIFPGVVFAIEPMVNAGTYTIETLADGWTVVTEDRRPSAHFEHTVAVTENGPAILTLGR